MIAGFAKINLLHKQKMFLFMKVMLRVYTMVLYRQKISERVEAEHVGQLIFKNTFRGICIFLGHWFSKGSSLYY